MGRADSEGVRCLPQSGSFATVSFLCELLLSPLRLSAHDTRKCVAISQGFPPQQVCPGGMPHLCLQQAVATPFPIWHIASCAQSFCHTLHALWATKLHVTPSSLSHDDGFPFSPSDSSLTLLGGCLLLSREELSVST